MRGGSVRNNGQVSGCYYEENPLSAVIRLTVKNNSLAPAVARSGLPFTEAIQSMQNRRAVAETDQSEITYLLTASDACGDSIVQQIQEATEFLTSNRGVLKDLAKLAPECKWELDFMWDFPIDSVGQFNRFPPVLLQHLVELNMDLVVSVYGTS